MSDEQKKKRTAVQAAWRLLTIYAASGDDDGSAMMACHEGAKKLEAAFPEYLGGDT